MPQIVEADFGKTGLLEQRLEGSLHEVLRVEGGANVASEDQAPILVESREPHPLLQLELAVGLESVHCAGCEVDQAPAPPSLGFPDHISTAFAHEGPSNVQHATLEVRIVP